MTNPKQAVLAFTMALCLALLAGPGLCSAQNESADPFSPNIAAVGNTPSGSQETLETTAKATDMSLFDLVKKGGAVGYMIITLSIISLGLIINYFYTIRRSRILPANDVTALRNLVQNHSSEEIAAFEKRRLSFLCRITLAGLKESHHGYDAMVKAMEDASEALSSGIARKTEHLNVIGNISPMLGLLGTVIGMLRCFNEIAHVSGAIEPKQLAGGIFEALITTCMGLIVAIPALYCYAILRNRVDEFTGEASLLAEQLVSPFKTNPDE